MVALGLHHYLQLKRNSKSGFIQVQRNILKKEKHSGNENCSKHKNEGFQMC